MAYNEIKRAAQKTKREEVAEEEDSESYPFRIVPSESYSITIQILQRQNRRRRKQKNGKFTPAEEKIFKIKFTSKDPVLFGCVQNLKEESKISRSKVIQFHVERLHVQNIEPFVLLEYQKMTSQILRARTNQSIGKKGPN